MADISKATDGPTPFDDDGFDYTKLPDWDDDFVNEDAIVAFEKALAAPDHAAIAEEDGAAQPDQFITALNDWRPIYQRVRKAGPKKKRKRKKPTRGKDETREGYVYTLLKWPLLIVVLGWIIVLAAAYATTRLYVFAYEHFVTMRGRREKLRKRLHDSKSYSEWIEAARAMDTYLQNDKWKEQDDYAYYNSQTIRSVRNELRRLRKALEKNQRIGKDSQVCYQIVDEIRGLVEAAAKDNFVGVENPRLYSETYYGTKDLAQDFIDEIEKCLQILSGSQLLSPQEKANMFAHLSHNYGRTALCLSGGATFAYYHFGVAKALLDANILPEIITGTSGGALVAALLATRTNDELKKLLVPALANRITACSEPFTVWATRWWRTGARFDSIQWARKCSWFCYGSLTFREAYERTGRILNVTCIPSDPHSPTVLANYLTCPDCVVWSAVIASAAVPGILNPVVLMRKKRDGTFEPYSFGHKWKDGSLRTDIPLRALNMHFNVNFSIVSQVNPHINLFFFSSRGTVGRPVTHRRGRGWRGGFLGSATEQYLKLDLYKWLKVLRHLELLPRFVGQDWSEIWLQRFSGTITIWPKSIPSDFANILSDPTPPRLARMLHVGQLSAFPKLKFVANRAKVERLIERGRNTYPSPDQPTTPMRQDLRSMFSEEDLQHLLTQARASQNGRVPAPLHLIPPTQQDTPPPETEAHASTPRSGVGFGERLSRWWSPGRSSFAQPKEEAVRPGSTSPLRTRQRTSSAGGPRTHVRRGSLMEELGRQSQVFFDDTDLDEVEGTGSEVSAAEGDG